MTLSEFQNQVREYDEKFGWTKDSPIQNLVHLQEELGEMARLILAREGYKDGSFSKQEFAEELVDTLYLTLKLANHYEIDLDDAWACVEERYGKK